MSLFKQQLFIGAGGLPLTWKIECDELTTEDWKTIAAVSAPKLLPFKQVVGVPRGGLRLAEAMEAYVDPTASQVLVVDDVWTTGKSMNAFAAFQPKNWIGLVAFTRGRLPRNVKAFMSCMS